jgi:hypothetical protein
MYASIGLPVSRQRQRARLLNAKTEPIAAAHIVKEHARVMVVCRAGSHTNRMLRREQALTRAGMIPDFVVVLCLAL